MSDQLQLRQQQINVSSWLYQVLIFFSLNAILSNTCFQFLLALHSYSSLATCNNFILATRRHYNSYVIDLIDMETEKLINTVDSNGCKLRRPAGMVAFSEVQDSVIDESQQCSSYYLLVTDVAADSVKKYQFF
jgi:hypothetical protein